MVPDTCTLTVCTPGSMDGAATALSSIIDAAHDENILQIATAVTHGVGVFAHDERPVPFWIFGIFDDLGDPLQSYVELDNPNLDVRDRRLTASELLAVNWRDVELVVFSACEGARIDARISNELHGLSWAPLVGGARQVVLSRWRVKSKSNARWIDAFYRALRDGQSTARARAAATLSVAPRFKDHLRKQTLHLG